MSLQNNRQSPPNHRHLHRTRLLLGNCDFRTLNTAIFLTQQRRKYFICRTTKQADLRTIFQLDFHHRRPWSCRPRSRETNLINSTPSLRWPALPLTRLSTEKFQALDCTSSTIPDLTVAPPFAPYRNSRATSVLTSTLLSATQRFSPSTRLKYSISTVTVQ